MFVVVVFHHVSVIFQLGWCRNRWGLSPSLPTYLRTFNSQRKELGFVGLYTGRHEDQGVFLSMFVVVVVVVVFHHVCVIFQLEW